MSATVEKISSNKVKISFDVESAKFDEAMAKAYTKVRGKVNIPGFRKGKAPRKVIEVAYGGESVFYDEAFEIIFDEVYAPAVEENKVEVVDRPQIDIQQIGTGKNLQFTCEVFVTPDVTLGEYKGVKAKREKAEVTEEAVDTEIENQRKKQAVESPVTDRAVADGDTVNLDYAGTVDGVAFAGGTADGQTLKIGSGSFIPGFEEQMIGMNIGEEKDLDVTFPEKYHSEELAGKKAVFHVKVNSITETQLPELNDEFAKDISEFDTLADYRADVRAKLEKAAQADADNKYTNAVLDAVIANATVDIPQSMIERQIDSMMQDFQYRLSAQGLKLEDFIKYTGSDMASFRNQYREQAEKSVKAHLVLSAIEKAEAIDATEEQVVEQISKAAEQNKMTVEDFKAAVAKMDPDYEAAFKSDAIRDNCVKFLTDNAVEEA